MALSIDAVYYVESTTDMNPIAIRPKFEKNVASWEDTSRGKTLHFKNMEWGSKKEKIPNTVSLILENNETVRFLFLTKKIFDEKVKTLVSGPLEFDNDQQVQNYYLQENFTVY